MSNPRYTPSNWDITEGTGGILIAKNHDTDEVFSGTRTALNAHIIAKQATADPSSNIGGVPETEANALSGNEVFAAEQDGVPVRITISAIAAIAASAVSGLSPEQYADTTGDSVNIAATFPSAASTLTDGYRLTIGVTHSNTTTSPLFTPTIGGVEKAALPLRKFVGNALVALNIGDLQGDADLRYDTVNLVWILQNPSPASALFIPEQYCDSTGTDMALLGNYPAANATLSDGYRLTLGCHATNPSPDPTFAPTLGGVLQSARPVVKFVNNEIISLAAGDLQGDADLRYDTVNLVWILQNPTTAAFVAEQHAHSTGSTTTYAATYSKASAFLTDGYRLTLGVHASNTTGAPAIALTLGGTIHSARTIVKYVANAQVALSVGDLQGDADLRYDAPGAVWILMNPSSSATAAYATTAGTAVSATSAGSATTAGACTGNATTATSAGYATSAGSCTGNALTASSCTGNSATATLATTASTCSGNSATATLATTATSATTAAACSGNAATATLATTATSAGSATTAGACTGNSATATTAAACLGNSATATVAVTVSAAAQPAITSVGTLIDLTVTNLIAGSIAGNAATATSATTAAVCSGNAATATIAGTCSGNAATATTASACSGNAATATTAIAVTGVSTNSSASAGQVGEYVASTIVSGSGVSLTTNTVANVTSINLTAGDWDVQGNIAFLGAATTSFTAEAGSVNITSATLHADMVSNLHPAIVPTAVAFEGMTVPIQRISVSATTTVYLVAKATFTVSTAKAYGTLRARRIR